MAGASGVIKKGEEIKKYIHVRAKPLEDDSEQGESLEFQKNWDTNLWAGLIA